MRARPASAQWLNGRGSAEQMDGVQSNPGFLSFLTSGHLLASSGLAMIMLGATGTSASAQSITPAAAQASTAVSSQSTGNAGTQVETVVVTAQIRKQNLQDVPISAQVVDGRQIAAQNINSLFDLSQTEPSVHISEGDGPRS